MTNNLYVINNK